MKHQGHPRWLEDRLVHMALLLVVTIAFFAEWPETHMRLLSTDCPLKFADYHVDICCKKA